MYYKPTNPFPHKNSFSPDFVIEKGEVSFFYTYIRKNASTSFKKLFKALHPDTCHEMIPSIGCMNKYARVKDLSPEEIEQRFATRLFIYRDPIERAFSIYKNKLIQQDGAKDLLEKLEKAIGRDPALLTFEEFIHEYVVLLEGDRWKEVDGHLYPQVWHLLPITYNKVIRMDNVYQEMQDLLPSELCDQVFKEPSNSTTKGSVSLPWADPDCPACFFRKKYQKNKALPSLNQLLTPVTAALLRQVYKEDYKMIDEIEELPTNLNSPNPFNPISLGLDFNISAEYQKG